MSGHSCRSGGEMEGCRIASKFRLSFESDSQCHWSFEPNVQTARDSLMYGCVEKYTNPDEVRSKLSDGTSEET